MEFEIIDIISESYEDMFDFQSFTTGADVKEAELIFANESAEAIQQFQEGTIGKAKEMVNKLIAKIKEKFYRLCTFMNKKLASLIASSILNKTGMRLTGITHVPDMEINIYDIIVNDKAKEFVNLIDDLIDDIRSHDLAWCKENIDVNKRYQEKIGEYKKVKLTEKLAYDLIKFIQNIKRGTVLNEVYKSISKKIEDLKKDIKEENSNEVVKKINYASIQCSKMMNLIFRFFRKSAFIVFKLFSKPKFLKNTQGTVASKNNYSFDMPDL